MAMLESTPYRVYYLIKKNRRNFSGISLNDSPVNSDNSNDTKRASIRVLFNEENNFDSVKLVFATRYENYNYYDDCSSYDEFKWNDIDDKVICLIRQYYDDHEDEYSRIVRYADMIQAMYENPDNISFSVDYEGRPRLDVSELPYVSGGKVNDLSVTISTLSDCYYNICINNHDPDASYSSESFTNSELHDIVSKAKKYDSLRSLVGNLLDYPEEILGNL